MNYETAKTPSAINLDGIKVEFEHQDNALKIATLTDKNGNVLRIVAGAYDGLKLFVPAKPKMEKRFAVVGTVVVDNVTIATIREVHDNRHQAVARKAEIENAFRSQEDVSLEVKEVDVRIDDAGQPITDDIPF